MPPVDDIICMLLNFQQPCVNDVFMDQNFAEKRCGVITKSARCQFVDK